MKKPSLKQAVLAMCHQCPNYWGDGKIDCEMVDCPLYHWQAYRNQEPDYSWMKLNPKRQGKVTWEDSKREMSEEDRLAAAERLKKAREMAKKSPVKKIHRLRRKRG